MEKHLSRDSYSIMRERVILTEEELDDFIGKKIRMTDFFLFDWAPSLNIASFVKMEWEDFYLLKRIKGDLFIGKNHKNFFHIFQMMQLRTLWKFQSQALFPIFYQMM